MTGMKRWWPPLLSPLLFVVACAPFLTHRIPQQLERPKSCHEFLIRLDEKVEAAGVRDASTFPIPGFPYLRTNRFFAALKKNLNDDSEKEAWVKWMQDLDLRSRKKEISNLPDAMVLSLMSKEQPNRESLHRQVESCSSELLNHDQSHPDFYPLLRSFVDVPDEYSWFLRAVGLYPLVVIPVAVVTENSREKIRKRFNTDLKDLSPDGSLKAFVPGRGVSLTEEEVQEIIEESKKNPLKIPLPDEIQEKKLVQAFAPIFVQDVAASYDRPGQVVWRDHRIEVNPERPTVYYYISYAFLKREPILQINYVIWYPERAGGMAPRIEHGHLDGLTMRMSLDGQGKLWMVDVQNNCGCYHLFAPNRKRVDRILSRPLMFDAMVPQWLPSVSSGERLGIRTSSGWHQVQRVISVKEAPDPISYELLPYEILETLPHEDDRTESIFDANGVGKGSERVERFILFSMGIPSVGSMRQRGHHAIELIGRVHFDDPGLFDKNFLFK